MKKLYTVLLSIFAATSFAQTTIFSEDMGTPPTNPAQTQIANHTFQNSSPIVFSGDAVMVLPNNPDIAIPSHGYEGASGGGCAAIFATDKTFMIEGINTLAYSDISLSFGQLKGNSQNSNTITIEVSEDGTTWSPLTYTGVPGSLSVWSLITTSGIIPSTENLRIRFSNPASTVAVFRIDDIKLVGTTLGISKNAIEGLKIYPNPVTNGTLYINTTANASKEVVIYDVLGKQVVKTTTENAVNVSKLNAGVYIVKVTEEGNTATRKLVIK
ncbi:T9SS type A sorting domain-containing protein [Flavobacterium sp. PLA-1-15]|uniref:T9SS type A sorting domain-containing protein n=1 Tax=Flavobacterium sp. PLA-1-15 TaxID=3380533 RepID=UPI003B815141